MSLRVLSYNVRYAELDSGENAWSERRDGVASVIRFHDPDVVCLQEVWLDQLSDLRERLSGYEWVGHHAHNGEHTPIGYRPERFSVADEAAFSLSETPEELNAVGWGATIPRITTTATLHDTETGRSFAVVNTHFDHETPRAREESARLLVDRIAGRPRPTVVAGDFNCTPEDGPYRTLVDAGLADARESVENPHGPETTFNDFGSPQPNRRIDHVLLTDCLTSERFGVRTDLDSRELYPSDHFALVVDVAFA